MQSRYLIGLLLPQVYTENICKKLVVAKPVALIILRGDKQVVSLQSLQQHSAFLLAGDGIAQRATQPVENEVWSKKLRTRSDWRCRTSSAR